MILDAATCMLNIAEHTITQLQNIQYCYTSELSAAQLRSRGTLSHVLLLTATPLEL